MNTRRFFFVVLGLSTLPLLMGAGGDGCSAASRSPAPDVEGAWTVTYEDTLGVEIKIGGAVYTSTVSSAGGVVTIDHEGQPIEFDLDCSRAEVVCPSEAWPEQVDIEQRSTEYEHQMVVTLPMQKCVGERVAADPASCGEGTLNPECEDVCQGDVVVEEKEAFGVIGEAGESFRLYLGAGIATNGINCALLGWSVADANLTTSGENTAEWTAEEMTDGVVTVGYAGGCLWVANADADPELEAAVVGASVTFTVPFTASRAN